MDVTSWQGGSPPVFTSGAGSSPTPEPHSLATWLPSPSHLDRVASPSAGGAQPQRWQVPGPAAEAHPVRDGVVEARAHEAVALQRRDDGLHRVQDVRCLPDRDEKVFWHGVVESLRRRDKELELRLRRVEDAAKASGRPLPPAEHAVSVSDPSGPGNAQILFGGPAAPSAHTAAAVAAGDMRNPGCAPLDGSWSGRPVEPKLVNLSRLFDEQEARLQMLLQAGPRADREAAEAAAKKAPGRSAHTGEPVGGVLGEKVVQPAPVELTSANIEARRLRRQRHASGPPRWARGGPGVPSTVYVHLDGEDQAYSGFYQKVEYVSVGECAVYGAEKQGADVFLIWAEHGRWVIARTQWTAHEGSSPYYLHVDSDSVVPLAYKESRP